MSKKYSSWTSNRPLSSVNTDVTMTKLISVKSGKQAQSKNLERVEGNSHMSNDGDVSSAVPTTVSPPLTNEQSKVSLVKKPVRDTSSAPSKRNRKHKHHYHHRGHCHHHHHHHNRRPRVKTASQQPTNIQRKVSNNDSYKADTNTSSNVPNEINNEAISIDDQRAPSVVSNQDHQIKPIKGNIPLQSIENKLLSQRVAPTNERQVGNFPSIICAQPTPSIINTCGPQQIEQIIYEDNCCYPSSTINYAPDPCYNPYVCLPQQQTQCNPYVCLPQQQLQCNPYVCLSQQQPQCDPYVCLPQQQPQCDPYVCLPQQQPQCDPYVCLPQQQPQLLFCTDPTSIQNYICSPSPTIHPTIINQIPLLNSLATTSSSQPYICLPQTSVQPTASFVIQQQPHIQAQPVRIIQTPHAQSAQYVQISSATPQVIQSVPGPAIQNLQPQIIQTIQVPTQTIAASPQILYQRPYDPIVIPVQNQPLAVAQTPLIALSQPSYAPARIVPAAPAPQPRGPRMFEHALVRSVANQTGLPVLSPSAGGLQLVQPPLVNPYRGAPLASTARALFMDGSKPSTSLPIVPLTAGGLLIPFQPSESPKSMIHGALPRAVNYPSGLRNFDNVRQQIQQRAQLLANLQRQNSNQISSLPMRSANTALPPLPVFSPNVPLSPSRFPSSTPNVPSGLPPRIPQPTPGIIRSQTPYASRNIFGTSSSSSSTRSVASSVLPASTVQPTPSGLIYSQPSFGGSRGGSILSGPSAPYQSLRP